MTMTLMCGVFPSEEWTVSVCGLNDIVAARMLGRSAFP